MIFSPFWRRKTTATHSIHFVVSSQHGVQNIFSGLDHVYNTMFLSDEGPYARKLISLLENFHTRKILILFIYNIYAEKENYHFQEGPVYK